MPAAHATSLPCTDPNIFRSDAPGPSVATSFNCTSCLLCPAESPIPYRRELGIGESSSLFWLSDEVRSLLFDIRQASRGVPHPCFANLASPMSLSGVEKAKFRLKISFHESEQSDDDCFSRRKVGVGTRQAFTSCTESSSLILIWTVIVVRYGGIRSWKYNEECSKLNHRIA
jgi:hypothetical protein